MDAMRLMRTLERMCLPAKSVSSPPTSTHTHRQEGCRRRAAPVSAREHLHTGLTLPEERRASPKSLAALCREQALRGQLLSPRPTTAPETGNRLLVLILRVTLVLKDSPASMTVPGLACASGAKCPVA